MKTQLGWAALAALVLASVAAPQTSLAKNASQQQPPPLIVVRGDANGNLEQIAIHDMRPEELQTPAGRARVERMTGFAPVQRQSAGIYDGAGPQQAHGWRIGWGGGAAAWTTTYIGYRYAWYPPQPYWGGVWGGNYVSVPYSQLVGWGGYGNLGYYAWCPPVNFYPYW